MALVQSLHRNLYDNRFIYRYVLNSVLSRLFIQELIGQLETFLCSFIVPILQVMLRDRLHIDDSKAQSTTTIVLFVHAFACAITAPMTGQISDRISSRKAPLLIVLGAELVGTVLCAVATSRM
jgi:MFS family permease